MSDSERIPEPTALKPGEGNGNGGSNGATVVPLPHRGLRRRHRGGGGDDGTPRRQVRIRKLRVFALLLGLGALAAVSTVFGMMMAVASDLPQLEEPAFRNSVILDTRGKEIGLLTGNQRQLFVSQSQIAPVMKHAIIAIEDRRFYTNEGYDLRGIGRALWQDVVKQRVVQGGSTITQQFVKNSLAAQDDRTVFVKLREAAMAYHLTRKWSKERILRNYLNTIYFGNGAYGIESAARTYFGNDHQGCETDKTRPCAAQLEPHEAALLAGVVASPSGYDPIAHPKAARIRRDLVLQRMFEQGFISALQLDASRAESLPTRADVKPPQEDTKYPYFTSWIKQQVVDKLGGGQTGARRAFQGGLTVQTTLDMRMQDAATNAINAWLPWTGGPRASMVAIHNKTGAVRAMVGGDDYATSSFNLATQGRRQPGSSFKPFVLAEALRQGISPGSTWASHKKVFTLKGGERFTVNNYNDGYLGVTTLANATTNSDNSVYAELGLKLGPRKVARMARRLGIRTPVSRNAANALGGLREGVTPLDMAHAYETFAQGGKLTYGTMSPGDANARKGTPVPGPVGLEAIGRGKGDDFEPLEGTDGKKLENRSAHARGDRAGRRQHGRVDPPDRREVGHRDPRVRPRRHDRRQDRNHRGLRRRVVRRLDAGVHDRGLGRLSGPLQADGDRIPGRSGGGRHLPGRDLQDVRRVARRPQAGQEGQPGDRAARAAGRRAGGHRDAGRRPDHRERQRRDRGRRRPARGGLAARRARSRGRGAGRGAAARAAGRAAAGATRRASAGRRAAARQRRRGRSGAVDARERRVGPGEPDELDAQRARIAGGRGRETLLEPAAQKRHGRSVALVMPTRGPTTTSTSSQPGAGRSNRTGPVARSVPLTSSSMPSAWVSLPGPEQSSATRSTPRRSRIAARPSSGSSARISTAAPTPSGSQTALSSAWMP